MTDSYAGMSIKTDRTLPRGEVRVTNEQTGGQKGRKPQRFELLPWAELADVSELYDFGATKYDDDNWKRGYAWSLSYGAMMRHATLFWEGEDYDAETGCHHMTSVVFHALALLYFSKHHKDLDDRYVTRSIREVNRIEINGLRNIVGSFTPYRDRMDDLPQGWYVCGPMTGHPQFNIPVFDAQAQLMRYYGFTVTSPAELDNPETRAAALASPDGAPGSGAANDETWGDFLSRDVKLISDDPTIEAILCLPGWLDSRGARLEVFCGGTLCGKRVFVWDDRCVACIGEEITDQVLTLMAEHGEPHLVPEAGKRVEDGRATAVAA